MSQPRIKLGFFPIGVQFYYEPPKPLDKLLNDMKVAKRLGINTLRFQISWCFTERKRGHLELDVIETLLDEAVRLGLYANIAVVLEQAPMWFWRQHPDACMVYSTGERHYDPTQYRYPYDGKPGPCWDNPSARAAGESFLTRFIRRLAVYENIIEWNVMQEIEFWPLDRNMSRPSTLGFCYCKYTLERFREWLKSRYSSLDLLNKAWGTAFGSWEEVEPPRLYDRVPAYVDWKYFIDNIYTTDRIKWKAKVVKRNDPLGRPVTAHVGKVLPGRGADWRWAGVVDIYGASCYPLGEYHPWDYGAPQPGKSAEKSRYIWWECLAVAFRYDYVRCAAKGKSIVAAAEFQGGPKGGLSRPPNPGDIRRWVLIALSSGVQELHFWNLRAEHFWVEAYGYGLLDSTGDTTPRAKEVSRIVHSINEYSELFRNGEVAQSQVAILINDDLWHFAEARGVPSIHETYRFDLQEHLSYTIRGIYAMLWDAGIWVDFVEINEVQTNNLSKYKVVILPMPLAADDYIFDLLLKYVKKGGILISEPCPGRHDRLGYARPKGLSPVAEELFGVKLVETRMMCEPRFQCKWTPTEITFDEILPYAKLMGYNSLEGHSVAPAVFLEKYEPTGSVPILYYKGSVAGVMNRVGDGKAYLIGTLLGHSYMAYRDKSTQKFLLALLKNADVTPEKCGDITRRRRLYRDMEAWFLFNISDKRSITTIRVAEKIKVRDLLSRHQLEVPSEVVLDPFEVVCLILEP